MEFYSFAKQHGRNITQYDSNFIISRLALTETRAAISCMYLEENGIIGYHEATVNQILYVVQGECDVCNEKKQYKTLRAGDAVFWEKGEWHETKTATGVTAIVDEGEKLSPKYLTKSEN